MKRMKAHRNNKNGKASSIQRFLTKNKMVIGIFFSLVIAAMGVYFTSRSFAAVPPPPAGGYTSLKPVGSFASLPNDAQAASLVHRSSWEPRPDNYTANHTVPPATFTTAGYAGMVNHTAVFGRVTGNFTGTTDEIIQWAAFKWGLPDDVIRAGAVAESYWYQNKKNSLGQPVSGQGYGDFGSCSGQGSPAPSGYGTTGPSSFGLLQDKWCALKDANAAGYDGWPWTETSTAYAVDLYASVMRGCYEGWDTWLGSGYTSGDLWGCIGRWYSGKWMTAEAQSYITTVQNHFNTKPWRSWPDYGVPTPPTDSIAPSTPTNLQATASSSTQVSLTWTASTDNVGVTGYNVYRNNVMITTLATNNFNDSGLTAGTNYSYYVVAKDASGNTSAVSNTASVTTPAIPPPPTTDTIAPIVSIASPANNSPIGRSVTISASATDNVKVSKMQIYIDGSLKATSTSGSIKHNWSSRNTSRGTHIITVNAYDPTGNVGTKSVTVIK